jgi:chemotaxis protein CheD
MFGGADMFGVRDGSATVGRQNIDKAVELMAAVGLRLVASDVGGPRGRKIFFNTSTGEVLLRRLSRQGSPAVPE